MICGPCTEFLMSDPRFQCLTLMRDILLCSFADVAQAVLWWKLRLSRPNAYMVFAGLLLRRKRRRDPLLGACYAWLCSKTWLGIVNNWQVYAL
jgi:hypothetical protein